MHPSRRVNAMEAGVLLERLDDDQRSAVTCAEHPLAVVAAAGSGKTTVLTRRIAHRVATGDADERHVLSITFTRQAAGELRRRLGELGLRNGVVSGTFHSVAFGIIRQRCADTGRPVPTLTTSRSTLLREAARGANEGANLGEIASELEWMNAQALTPGDYASGAYERGRRTSVPAGAIAAVVERYADVKRKRGVVDFDDLLIRCTDELRRDPAFAAATRWRFRHLFVDEFQDINPSQFRLLEQLRGDRSDLCVVGDPRQAIYGWNGSDPRFLDEVERTFPGVRIIRLRNNYRCSPAIVEAGRSVLRAAGTSDDSVAVRPDVGRVVSRSAVDETAEAELIAREVRGLRAPGGTWRSIAVLARTNAQLPPIERALRAAAVPVRRFSTLERRPEIDDLSVRQLLADARTFALPEQLRVWATDLASGLDGATATPLHGHLAAAVRRFLDASPRGDGRGFCDWYLLDDPADRDDDAVELLTFHAAKGREWRNVVLAGVEKRLVPHSGATAPGARAEECRLAYVALTRAAENVVLTWSSQRGGRPSGRSDLLASIDTEDAGQAGESGESGEPPELVTTLRAQRIRPAPSVDPAVSALLQWRTSAARASGLPEAAICTDETLRAVAAALPRTIEELAAVPGVGQLAAQRLGPRVLAVLDDAPA
jgi:DNA helicase II / ATP-dependent DNA helicase PcrA